MCYLQYIVEFYALNRVGMFSFVKYMFGSTIYVWKLYIYIFVCVIINNIYYYYSFRVGIFIFVKYNAVSM